MSGDANTWGCMVPWANLARRDIRKSKKDAQISQITDDERSSVLRRCWMFIKYLLDKLSQIYISAKVEIRTFLGKNHLPVTETLFNMQSEIKKNPKTLGFYTKPNMCIQNPDLFNPGDQSVSVKERI